MKKSHRVPATLVAAMAASLTVQGCSSQKCVDAQGNVLPDSMCRSGSSYAGAHYIRTGGFGGSDSTSGTTGSSFGS
ncbi:MAG: hypothetical protein JSS66_02350 [Armatimonadetes bacterium]|nr:hypothetical protein [Armatimonadota bacterium]